jgi:multisubunit Na+/H+ antiporter MnhF subunit
MQFAEIRLKSNDPKGICVIGILSGLLFACPTLAYAHDMSFPFYVVPWFLIMIFQIFCLYRIVGLKEMEGRRVAASLIYSIILGTLWWFIFYGFQVESQSFLDLAPGSAREKEYRRFDTGPTIEGRQTHQYHAFQSTFGSDLAGGLHLMFIFGVPILLPPFLAWGLYRALKSEDRK